MKKRKKLIEEIGWAGAFAVILGYALTSFNVVSVNSWVYHVLNLFGSLGIIVLATAKHTEQTVIVGSVRGIIAFVSLSGILVHQFLN